MIGSKKRAISKFNNIKQRCLNPNSNVYHHYKNKLNITPDQFYAWFMPIDFEGCHVDRINPDGNYEIGNLQLLTPAEHYQKTWKDREAKMKQRAHKYCYVCKEIKEIELFTNSTKSKDGKGYKCKECNRRLSKLCRNKKKSP